ncbi:hypothetical protein [Petrachloros mirabilis]
MLITELPFGQPGRAFRSPMLFGKYDPEGIVYEAFRTNAILMIVLLAEDRERKDRTLRRLSGELAIKWKSRMSCIYRALRTCLGLSHPCLPDCSVG